ncbi:MAG: ribonuclease HI family protein [Elusimicrobiota bacterium]
MIPVNKLLNLLAQNKSLNEISEILSCKTNEIKSILLKIADSYHDPKSESVSDGKLEKDGKVLVFSDGASRGNPGPSSIACVILNSKKQEITHANKYIGKATNNEAEYMAILLALDRLDEMQGVKSVDFFTDSQLVARQINGEYKVSNNRILEFVQLFMDRIKKYPVFSITHIPRGENKYADMLANMALDEHIKSFKF